MFTINKLIHLSLIRFKYNTQNTRIFAREIEKSKIDYQPNKMTIESEAKKLEGVSTSQNKNFLFLPERILIFQKDFDNWENKRIPRPWDEWKNRLLFNVSSSM